eukprot:scaffold244628_cov28-Tisochrysis_lutea.AAC.1
MLKRYRRLQLFGVKGCPVSRSSPNENVHRSACKLVLEVLEPVGDAGQMKNVTIFALLLERSPTFRFGLTGFTPRPCNERAFPRWTSPSECVHLLFIWHAMHQASAERRPSTLLESFTQGICR